MTVTEGLVKFIAGGLLVLLVSLAGSSGRGNLAGVVALFPVVTAISYYFLSKEADMNLMKTALASSIIAIPAILAFLMPVYLLVGRLHILKAIGAGIAAWLITSGLILLIKGEL